MKYILFLLLISSAASAQITNQFQIDSTPIYTFSGYKNFGIQRNAVNGNAFQIDIGRKPLFYDDISSINTGQYVAKVDATSFFEYYDYSDSLITLKLTQRTAWWITKSIQINADTRKLPDGLKPYVGSGTKPDSTFTVTLKAGLVRDGMELLLTRPLLLSLTDYNSIILGSPAVTGYTALGNQVATISNGNGAQKLTAQWLLDWYSERVATFNALYNEEKAAVIKLVQ